MKKEFALEWARPVKLAAPSARVPVKRLLRGSVATAAAKLTLLCSEDGAIRFASFRNIVPAGKAATIDLVENQAFIDEIWAASKPLRLAPSGTEFQQSVWTALLAIPMGETRSYKDVASMTGHKNPRIVARAVGQAVGANPIVPFIPCHRVLAAGGLIGGYSGGTLDFKRSLLALEGVAMIKAA